MNFCTFEERLSKNLNILCLSPACQAISSVFSPPTPLGLPRSTVISSPLHLPHRPVMVPIPSGPVHPSLPEDSQKLLSPSEFHKPRVCHLLRRDCSRSMKHRLASLGRLSSPKLCLLSVSTLLIQTSLSHPEDLLLVQSICHEAIVSLHSYHESSFNRSNSPVTLPTTRNLPPLLIINLPAAPHIIRPTQIPNLDLPHMLLPHRLINLIIQISDHEIA